MTKNQKCEHCGKAMNKGAGCTMIALILKDGKRAERTRFGEHDIRGWTGDKFCHDCNVRIGQFHHFGCDMERCPFCGMQLLMCECPIERAVFEVKEVKK